MRTRMSAMVSSIRQDGEMKRATWDPANIVGLSGWPLRNYLWWREKKGYNGPENFCHFMRVALFWAPLRWVGYWADKIIFDKRFIVTIVGLSILYLVSSGSVALVLLLVSIPVVGFVAVEVGKRLGPFISRGGKWFFGAHPSFAPWLRPWVVVVAAIGVLAPFSELALTATLMITIVLLFVGLMIGAGWSIDRQTVASKKRQELAKQRILQLERELYLRTLFSIVHPKWVGNEARFFMWLARYEAWHLETTGRDINTMRVTEIAFRAPWPATIAHMEALSFYEENRREATEPVRLKPAKARRRLIPLGVVTFFQLVWAFVVTNKWKICPIISIPTPQES